MSLSIQQRFLGSVLTGALGDAWGAAYEGAAGPVVFTPPQSCYVTDDTQLTLATCEAITAGRVTPAAVAGRMLAWHRRRRLRGLGASTLHALQALEAGAHWALAGRSGEFSAGAGAAMRAAPLGFVLDPANPSHRLVLKDCGRITHRNDEAQAGVIAIAAVIQGMLRGRWDAGTSMAELAVAELPDSRLRDRLQQVISEPAALEAAASRGLTGHVAHVVPFAIQAAELVRHTDPISVLQRVIECGGDADTNASIAGQLMGAAVGVHPDVKQSLHSVAGAPDIRAIAGAAAHTLATARG